MMMHIDARNRSSSTALERVYDEMTVQRDELQSHDDDEQSLLDLLDSVKWSSNGSSQISHFISTFTMCLSLTTLNNKITTQKAFHIIHSF